MARPRPCSQPSAMAPVLPASIFLLPPSTMWGWWPSAETTTRRRREMQSSSPTVSLFNGSRESTTPWPPIPAHASSDFSWAESASTILGTWRLECNSPMAGTPSTWPIGLGCRRQRLQFLPPPHLKPPPPPPHPPRQPQPPPPRQPQPPPLPQQRPRLRPPPRQPLRHQPLRPLRFRRPVPPRPLLLKQHPPQVRPRQHKPSTFRRACGFRPATMSVSVDSSSRAPVRTPCFSGRLVLR